MLSIEDIKNFWINSELTSIYNINEIATSKDDLISTSLKDANDEMSVLRDDLPDEIYYLYAKRLCVAIILSRLNVNANATQLPLQEADYIRNLIKLKIENQNGIQSIHNLLVASKGETSIKKELRKF